MTTPVLVFDLDGTLLETMGDLTASMNHVLVEAGFEAIEPERVRKMVGAGVKVLMSRGLEANKVEVTEEVLEPLLTKFIRHYETHIADHTYAFPQALETVANLREAGWKTAICTNKLEKLAKPLVRAKNMEHLFDAVVGGDTFSKNKPDAMPVFGAIDIAGGSRAGSIFVGDSKADIAAARNAGLPVIAVDFGYTDIPVRELGPDVVISHFNQLEAAVKELSEESSKS
ncbi:Phosphoglycolate phosphatase [Pseudovibrio axinellae]|uniref:Phosphoglycolate phosphatase n=1 Tax=Pseudovibrio axinellae TaxID=989403 RepID=A0A165XK60_9HYPH|nr:HAD family hydrolase [Pseudovibrio axinellae]KZL17784.1 Phosphoglycolate phosphatase [Pseudovibrio axinellae]SEP72715.1 phosphoglycolate phosphatase [Pseudovibrio axinellae]